MSNKNLPDSRGEKAVLRAGKKLARISLPETEAKLDNYLFEAASKGIEYISGDIRNAYCHAEGLLVLPNYLSKAVKSRAAEIFILRSRALHTRLQALYNIKSTTL